MSSNNSAYPASLDIDYPEKLDRLSSFFRFIWAIPILIVLTALTSSGGQSFVYQSGSQISQGGGDILSGLFCATALMIIFRRRYPRWWFDFVLELNRFSTRVGAYIFLLTDRYPSTVEKQTVHLDVTYPDVEHELNNWLPIVKWLLAIPHYIVLIVLMIGAIFATVFAWFAIIFTGRYPRGLFDYIVGVGRWSLRVYAYAFMLVTDVYPPFSLK